MHTISHALYKGLAPIICFVGCMIAFGGSAFSAETPITQKRSETLRAVLEAAKQKGLVQSKDHDERTASGRSHQADISAPPAPQNGETIMLATLSCDAFSVLKFGTSKEVDTGKALTRYEDLSGFISHRKSAKDIANAYLSFGLIEEAYAAIADGGQARAILLRAIATSTDPLSRRSIAGFSALEEKCAIYNPAVRMLLAETIPKLPINAAAETELMRSLEALPYSLRSRLTKILAIKFIDAGHIEFANRLMIKFLDTSASAPFTQGGDVSALYSEAMTLDDTHLHKAPMLDYLASAGTVYSYRAVNALDKTAVPSEHNETHLISVAHQFAGHPSETLAGQSLADLNLKRGEIIQAIDTIIEHIDRADPAYPAEVSKIGSAVFSSLSSDDVAGQIGGLDGYFYAPSFFELSDNIEALTLAVIKTASNLGLTQLALEATNHSPAHTQRDEPTNAEILQAVSVSLLNKDIDGAKALAASLPGGDMQVTAQRRIAVHEQNWDLVKAMSRSAKASDTDLPVSVIDILSHDIGREADRNPVGTLTSAAQYSAQIGADTKHVRGYLNGR